MGRSLRSRDVGLHYRRGERDQASRFDVLGSGTAGSELNEMFRPFAPANAG
jgi:hypothetical protein